MKKYIKALAASAIALTGVMAFSACSEDKVYEVDVNAVPQAADYDDAVKITVDQATNTAYFTFAAPGVYPVWIIDGKSYSTAHEFSRYYRKAGEYQVEVKIGNANGMSNGTLVKTFNIEKTAMNGFGGFVFDSPANLWLSAQKKLNSFFYAPGWSQIADPDYTLSDEGLSVRLTAATTDQWQAQMHIGTDICLPQGEHYDGSFIFTASQNINKVTLKIHPDGDDDDSHSFFCNQTINLTAGEPITYWFSDLEAAVDMNNLVFTFDFGGNPENIEIMVENLVLKKTSDNDGTVLPELPSTPEPTWVDAASADNFWSAANINTAFYYAPGWAQIADPNLTFSGKDFTVELPSATSDQWQAQVMLHTDLTCDDTEALYDFKICLESNTDLPGVTVKLVETNYDDTDEGKRDNNFFFAERVPVPAGGITKFWIASVKAPEAMHAISLVLDFGGNPDGTEVKVSDIVFQRHHD